MGRPTSPLPPPSVYSDDPDLDDAVSTSSTTLLEEVEYPKADPPAYEDVAGEGQNGQSVATVATALYES